MVDQLPLCLSLFQTRSAAVVSCNAIPSRASTRTFHLSALRTMQPAAATATMNGIVAAADRIAFRRRNRPTLTRFVHIFTQHLHASFTAAAAASTSNITCDFLTLALWRTVFTCLHALLSHQHARNKNERTRLWLHFADAVNIDDDFVVVVGRAAAVAVVVFVSSSFPRRAPRRF